MVAQMMKDGSFKAHSINKAGKMEYNQYLDERVTAPSGKAFISEMERRFALDGIPLKNGKLPRGYDREMADTFKVLADSYVIGEYDLKTSNLMAAHTLGEQIQFLHRWLFTRFVNAFGSPGKYRQSGGRLEMIEKDGEWVPEYQRLAIDGYVKSWWNWLTYSIRNVGNPDRVKWDDRPKWEQKNVVKFSATIGMFIAVKAMFYALSFIKVGDDDKPLTDYKVMKIANYATDSLLVMTSAIDLISAPFAAISILKRGFVDPFGDVNLNNMKNLIPLQKTAGIVDESYEMMTGQSIIDDITE